MFPDGRQTLTIADAGGESVSIAYGEKGTGQPLLLLHGIGSWSYNWRYSIDPLSQQFRVICADAKGYGFSQASSQPETVGHQVIELERVIRCLSDVPVILVGESLGALVALALAQAQPALVDRLVLLNAPVFPQALPNWGMQLIANLPIAWAGWVDQHQLLRTVAPLVRELTCFVRQEVVVDPTTITDEEIYWLTYPYIEIPGTLTQFATDLHLAALEIERSQQHQPNWISTIQEKLPQVACPTLILSAEHDRWFPAADGEKLHVQLPNSRFQIMPDCGHVAAGGNPDTINAAILNFLLEAG